MGFTDLFSKFFKEADRTTTFQFIPDHIEGGIFSLPVDEYNKVKGGSANEWLTYQYVTLKMLEEQGQAESIPNGFIVPSQVLSSLDNEACTALGLPAKWNGCVNSDIKGNTGRSSFNVELQVIDPHGNETYNYKIIGPIIQFGSTQQFLLSSQELNLFDALTKHQQSSRNEEDNLNLIYALQAAQSEGVNLRLQHFETIKIHKPDHIAVEIELDAFGNLVLMPQTGQEATREDMERVIGQLSNPSAKTLKVGDEIILFDEQKLEAVKEIIENRVVPKSKVKEFLEKPSAFINSSLVDLDLGFSIRVKGATSFKHAYFGETDESGMDWFGQSSETSKIYPFSKIVNDIEDEATFKQIEEKVSDAIATGATEIQFDGKNYDISDTESVKPTLEKINEKLNSSQPDNPEEQLVEDSIEPVESTQDEVIVVDIDLNDEDLCSHSPIVESKIADISRQGELDWQNYKRTPFKHQEVGVRWALGLIDKAQSESQIKGALLADDMGLGKTFMALSTVEHLYRELKNDNETLKPTLIVAPLSLLENWKDEVDKTFVDSPFSDIVILQSDAELNRFRSGGVETRSAQNEHGDFEPKYSLNIGKGHADRLDMPGRLVITTYQTMRDYQFSLCLIDWGIVIFDEAQNIKNPNALQTRAAKGLKSSFKLVATGTPVENSLADFWCLMDTACPEYLGSYQDFRANYITPIVQAAGDEVDEIRARVGRELRIAVGSLMLRRIKEDNLDGLPTKTMYVGTHSEGWSYLPKLGPTMRDYQQKVYEGAIDAMEDSEQSHVLGTLQRLRNSSLHPRLADGGQLNLPKSQNELNQLFEESGKLTSLLNLLVEIKARQEKCIIFAVNKRLQTFLSLALGKRFNLGPLSIINGDAKAVAKKTGTPTRKSMIKEFEEKPGFNLIVMSPVAAGVGLTVVGANNVVHFERHWNPAKEAQATDRVYRIGQTKDVNIYVPILLHPSMESFDANLHKLLTKKTRLKDAVVTPEDVIPMPEGFQKQTLELATVISAKEINKLNWRHFEALTLEVMAKETGATSSWLTVDGADKGADGVLETPEGLVLIQAKFTKTSYDGYEAVKEINFAKTIYQDALNKQDAKLLFMTNATKLSKRTREIAEQFNVEIINGEKLIDLVAKHKITFKQIMSRMDKKRLTV